MHSAAIRACFNRQAKSRCIAHLGAIDTRACAYAMSFCAEFVGGVVRTARAASFHCVGGDDCVDRLVAAVGVAVLLAVLLSRVGRTGWQTLEQWQKNFPKSNSPEEIVPIIAGIFSCDFNGVPSNQQSRLLAWTRWRARHRGIGGTSLPPGPTRFLQRRFPWR